jgi:hypothetical protein
MRTISVSLALGALALCSVPSAPAASSQTQAPVAADTGTTVQDTDIIGSGIIHAIIGAMATISPTTDRRPS